MSLWGNSYVVNSRTVTGTVTVYNTDTVLACTTSGGAVTINLPAIPPGNWATVWKLYVYDASANAATYNITINAGSGQTINGASTLVLNVNSVRAIIEISSDTSFNALVSTFISSSGITQAYQTVQDEGSSLTQRTVINFVGAGVTATDAGGKTVVTIPTQQAYATMQDEGIDVTQRSKVDFVGGGVTVADNSIAGKTVVTIPTQQAYSTAEDEGTPLTQRSTMNFVGAGVTAADSGGKTVVTIPGMSWVAPSYFYAKKSLTTGDSSFNIAPVAAGTRSVFGGLQVIEYTSEVESGLTFNSSTGEFTVPSTGLYSLNAKFTTRIKADDINSLVNGTGDPWTAVATDQLAIAILIERGGGGANMIVCSNKQTINATNISDINIECSSLLFSLTQNDIVYVVIFNKTAYTIVNLAAQPVLSGLPDCYIDFSCFKIS